MNITCLFFGIAFLTAGAVFFLGKAHIHISAWKNMQSYEKEKIRILPLCRNIGISIAVCGLIFLIGGLSACFKDHAFVWAMIMWLILSGIDVYYIGKSGRYVKK